MLVKENDPYANGKEKYEPENNNNKISLTKLLPSGDSLNSVEQSPSKTQTDGLENPDFSDIAS